MKTLAIVAGTLVTANALANIGLKTLQATGGSVVSLLFIGSSATAYLLRPAPMNLMKMVDANAV